MSALKNGPEMRPTAERLAQAMRSGLDSRWSVSMPRPGSPAPFPPHGNVRPFLEPYADSLWYHLQERRNPLQKLLRVVRHLMRKLIAPWLSLQSSFNFAALSVLEQFEQRLRTLEDGKLGPHFVSNGSRGPAVGSRILERIFVHMHLPCPPARLLALGCNDDAALEMASLGFHVVGMGPRASTLQHPNLTVVQARLEESPLEDESFDGVVVLSSLSFPEDMVFRVLKRGGRFILTVPFGRSEFARTQRQYDHLLQGFRVVERGYGIRDSDTWLFTREGWRAEQADRGEGLAAVSLLVLEKP